MGGVKVYKKWGDTKKHTCGLKRESKKKKKKEKNEGKGKGGV